MRLQVVLPCLCAWPCASLGLPGGSPHGNDVGAVFGDRETVS